MLNNNFWPYSFYASVTVDLLKKHLEETLGLEDLSTVVSQDKVLIYKDGILIEEVSHTTCATNFQKEEKREEIFLERSDPTRFKNIIQVPKPYTNNLSVYFQITETLRLLSEHTLNIPLIGVSSASGFRLKNKLTYENITGSSFSDTLAHVEL